MAGKGGRGPMEATASPGLRGALHRPAGKARKGGAAGGGGVGGMGGGRSGVVPPARPDGRGLGGGVSGGGGARRGRRKSRPRRQRRSGIIRCDQPALQQRRGWVVRPQRIQRPERLPGIVASAGGAGEQYATLGLRV